MRKNIQRTTIILSKTSIWRIFFIVEFYKNLENLS